MNAAYRGGSLDLYPKITYSKIDMCKKKRRDVLGRIGLVGLG
jgi:hypothetical protein